MKLLRVGQKGSEKPAALDKEGKIRDISSHIADLNPEHVNFETMSKLQNVDLSSLPELSSSERIGSCITKPGKFVAIGLNSFYLLLDLYLGLYTLHLLLMRNQCMAFR